VARWIFAVLALLAVATAGVFVFVGRHPVLSAPGPRSTPDATATPSATPEAAAIAEAAKQYLAAVVSVNADGDRFHAALAADAALPCSCSPGEFAIRADTVAQIPALSRDIENLQGVLQTIKYEAPGIAADINTVVMDNQQYVYWLAAAYRSSEQPGEANVGSDISTAVALDTASGPDFVRLRADLGLPPPPTG
jgi:Na+-transporting methylmalonyl-CoA/oxaloacetate decarboxylase gamma subunit